MGDSETHLLLHNLIIVTQGFVNSAVENRSDYIAAFKAALESYHLIGEQRFRENFTRFIQRVIPVAEELNIMMCIHPDDPPFPLLGLPRIASTVSDFNGSLHRLHRYITGWLSAWAHWVLINAYGSLTERSKKVISKTPMGCFGDISELNGAVQFLCRERRTNSNFCCNMRLLPCGNRSTRYENRQEHVRGSSDIKHLIDRKNSS